MRRIVVTEFISLDGVVEDPGGAEGYRHGGWTFGFNGAEGTKYKLEETSRTTRCCWAASPTRASPRPGRPARRAGSPTGSTRMKKYVVSSTLTDPAGPTRGARPATCGGDRADQGRARPGHHRPRQRAARAVAARARTWWTSCG